MGAQMLMMCITVFMIDILCKNLYDENGVRIDPEAAPEEPAVLEDASRKTE